jgi:hypothetical protein
VEDDLPPLAVTGGYPDRSDVSDRGPSAATGTRAVFSLDPAYFAPGSSLPADATGLKQDAGSQPLPGTLAIVDLRHGLFASGGASGSRMDREVLEQPLSVSG